TDARARLIASASRGGVGNLETIRLPGAREGETPPGPIVAEYVRDGRRLIGAFTPVQHWAMGALVDKTVDAALLPVSRITWATLLWIAVAALIGSIAARIFARRLSDRGGPGGRNTPDRGREAGGAHRPVGPRRA